ncbi:hypothetical protein MPER_12381, partial [Moniliophthora perniciosa FA553]
MNIYGSFFEGQGHTTFVNICGDQFNTTTMNAEVINATERTRFGEFREVKRGHVIAMKDLGSVDLLGSDWHFKNGESVRIRGRKTISTVKIHPDLEHTFTAYIRRRYDNTQGA